MIDRNSFARLPRAHGAERGRDGLGHLAYSAQVIDQRGDVGAHDGINLHIADYKSSPSLSDLQIIHLHYAAMDAEDLDTKAARLRAARERKGYRTAKLAAEAMGVPYGTYSGHEAGSRGIKDDDVARYSRFFRVPIAWLGFGIGSMEDHVSSVVQIDGLVGAGGEIDTRVSQAYSGDVAEIELDIPVPSGIRAFEVWGNSMLPKWDPGDVVLIQRGADPIDLVIGAVALVLTDAGVRYLKRVLRGSAPGLYDLESFNAPTMKDQRILEAGLVYVSVPANQVRRPIGDKEVARRYRKPKAA